MAIDFQPKSLRDLVHLHGIWKSPLAWTSTHLDLLGCQFKSDDASGLHPEEHHSTRHPQVHLVVRSAASANLAETMTVHRDITVRQRCLEFILRKDIFTRVRARMPERWMPPCVLFIGKANSWECLAGDPARFAGFIDYAAITKYRWERIWSPGPADSQLPQASIDAHAFRVAQITPKNWCKDPYFSYLLLVVAQTQHFRCEENCLESTYTPRLLVHNWYLEPNHIYLFWARFSAKMIQALKGLFQSRESVQWPSIQWEKLPIKPYNSFKEQLVSEIFQGSRKQDQAHQDCDMLHEGEHGDQESQRRPMKDLFEGSGQTCKSEMSKNRKGIQQGEKRLAMGELVETDNAISTKRRKLESPGVLSKELSIRPVRQHFKSKVEMKRPGEFNKREENVKEADVSEQDSPKNKRKNKKTPWATQVTTAGGP
ncbi:hypothetical protein N7532_012104 [Penicillium argentinense]|uniref:Uncharacterized protein n=1 Tax=Penicillium argentinense TaxID=1131581 RepID=A0A9W9EJN3_9EURO|nr:uncharacterized protein N7532_012104 [Penicillium argentinense]KAJ5083061.1 hypothetical protein N7532_012104 [Penicillium argentinense]